MSRKPRLAARRICCQARRQIGPRSKRYFRQRIEVRRATKFRRGCLLGNLAAEVNEKTSPKLAKAVQNGLLAFENDVASS
jgi:TetR/AcrR family transcriptional repressor of nem operon